MVAHVLHPLELMHAFYLVPLALVACFRGLCVSWHILHELGVLCHELGVLCHELGVLFHEHVITLMLCASRWWGH